MLLAVGGLCKKRYDISSSTHTTRLNTETESDPYNYRAHTWGHSEIRMEMYADDLAHINNLLMLYINHVSSGV